MNNKKLVFALMFSATALFLNKNSNAQQLELSSSSHSTASIGPLQVSNPASFFRNVGTSSTFSTYTPATTFTVSLSNQQYTTATLPGVTLGYSSGGVFKPVNNGVGSNTAASSYFTSSPNIATAGTNFNTSSNYGFLITVDPGYQKINSQPLNARNYYSDLTVSFNRPVINPVLHFCGIGKAQSTVIAHPTTHMYLGNEGQGFYPEFELSTNDVANGITLTKLSGDGDFSVVNANKIVNSNTETSDYSGDWTSIEAFLSAGSVRVNSGNTPISSVTFRLYLRGDGGTNYTGYGAEWPGIGACIEDFTLSASLGMVNLSGSVYEDNDGMIGGVDGSPMPGVTVGLFENNGTTLLSTTTTSSTGYYTFLEVPAGEYVVKVTAPADYAHVSSTDVTPTDGSTNVKADGITDVTHVDFGLKKTGSLPVKLISFMAGKTETSSQLTWSTTEETNSDHFEIQHSSNAKDWSAIGEVNASGESKEVKNYEFTHTTPVSGSNYYRLKMVDRDATYAYSRIAGVSFQGINNFNVYPNPVSSLLMIKDTDQQLIKTVEIIDINGKVVYKHATGPRDTFSKGIDISTLPNGAYVVRISSVSGVVTASKIVVAH